MDETNFNWDDLKLFLAVARGGGLSAAAASTGKSAPTLGRRMVALERRLGSELFRRMARGYQLTDEGEALLTKAASVESRVLSLMASRPDLTAPLVKISAGTWVTHLLCGRTSEIAGQGEARLRFIAADEVLDIGRREAVVGIRNHRPTGVGLAGRRVGRIQFAVYASEPEIKVWASVLGPTPSAKWVEDEAGSADVIEVTSPRNALDLALVGAARVVLPSFVGSRLDRLQQVTPLIEELEHDQWLVTHHEDQFIPEIRRVIDRIYAVLKETCVQG